MTYASEEGDWEITPDGLYMATRRFLTKRGYCCANQCRNCPYINWHNNSAWHPVDHQYVRETKVSPKVINMVSALLIYHEKHSTQEASEKADWHRTMALHYAFLLKTWTKA